MTVARRVSKNPGPVGNVMFVVAPCELLANKPTSPGSQPRHAENVGLVVAAKRPSVTTIHRKDSGNPSPAC